MVKSVTQATAKEVVKFLRDEVCLKHATPKIIVSDSGVQYESMLYKEFLEEFDIEPHYTARYFPQANCTEAANKTLGNAIKSFFENDKSHRDWDIHLQEIADAMNNSKHTATDETPNSVVFGQKMPQHASEYEDSKARLSSFS